MAAVFITITQLKVFDQSIFTIITVLKKKQKHADINKIHSEIIKTLNFKDITKEYLQDRINTLISNEKRRNKQKKQQEYGLLIRY